MTTRIQTRRSKIYPIKGWTQEEINLALERGLPHLTRPDVDIEGGFAWAWLLPILGSLAAPIAQALAKKIGVWISDAINKPKAVEGHFSSGGLFTPVGGLFGPVQGHRRGGLIAMRPGVSVPQHATEMDDNFRKLHRGANTAQMSLLSMNPVQGRNIDRINNSYIRHSNSIEGGVSVPEGFDLIQKELMPYIHDASLFKKKLIELVKLGKKHLKAVKGGKKRRPKK